MLDANTGFLVFSTDFALSSHLKRFEIPADPQIGPELYVTLGYFVPALVHTGDLLFWPEGGSHNGLGILVFDADNGALLTEEAIATSGPPSDLVLLEAPGCIADLDGDGTVGAADLALLLGAWGPVVDHPADLNNDGAVNAADLAVLLGNWGACA